jgi:pimeloyl-ACP methyl ester carboxylesterase
MILAVIQGCSAGTGGSETHDCNQDGVCDASEDATLCSSDCTNGQESSNGQDLPNRQESSNGQDSCVSECTNGQESCPPECTNGQATFYDIFAGASGLHNELNSLLLKIPDAINNPVTSLEELDSTWKMLNPTDFFSADLAAGLAPWPESKINETLGARSMTLVVLPGIFSEFIETGAYGEFFDGQDTLGEQEWLSAYQSHADIGDTTDAHFLLGNLMIGEDGSTIEGEEIVPLVDLVHIASEDKDGKVLFRGIRLAAPRLSLESMGSIKAVAAVYLRRLDKVFRILPNPENVVFVGYSRGTTVALEMVKQALADGSHPWFGNVTAVVSVAGVVLGTHLADKLDDPASLEATQLAILRDLGNSLEEVDPESTFSKLKVPVKNAAKWAVALQQLAASIGLPTIDDLRAALKTLPSVSVSSLVSLVLDIGAEFGLDSFASEYNENIRRFRKVVAEAEHALTEIGTTLRKQWWTQAILPTDLQYLAVGTTLAGADADMYYGRNLGVMTGSADDENLHANYDKYAEAAGMKFNDSQVALHRMLFPAPVLESFSAAHKNLQGELLGIFATHHWGIALQRVTNESDNPFPRSAFLKSLATLIAYRLASCECGTRL